MKSRAEDEETNQKENGVRERESSQREKSQKGRTKTLIYIELG